MKEGISCLEQSSIAGRRKGENVTETSFEVEESFILFCPQLLF